MRQQFLYYTRRKDRYWQVTDRDVSLEDNALPDSFVLVLFLQSCLDYLIHAIDAMVLKQFIIFLSCSLIEEGITYG